MATMIVVVIVLVIVQTVGLATHAAEPSGPAFRRAHCQSISFTRTNLETSERDRYGGLRGCELKASGFFGAERATGGNPGERWWLVNASNRDQPVNIFHSWKSWVWDEVRHAPKVYTKEHLEMVREEGYNAIWLHGAGLREMSRSDVFPEFNKPSNQAYVEALNTVVERAEGFGIRVFLYVVEPRGLNVKDSFWRTHPELRGTKRPDTVHAGEMEYSMCTSCPEVLDFLENSTANLFRLVPGLAGLKLITASEYTHHCLAFATPVWPDLFKTQYDSLCPRCRDRDAVQLVAEIVNRVAKGAYAAKPEAEILAKNWDWHWYEPHPHKRLINSLDPRVAVGANINLRGTKEDADGVRRRINEYALSYVGPSEPGRQVVELCRQTNRKFYVQLVLGTTHECFVVPHIPVPGRVYEKVAAAKALEPHGYYTTTFGTIPSVNTRVLKKMLAVDGVPQDKEAFLEELARECFPGCCPALVRKAWRHFSMAMSLYPFDNQFLYRGPMNYALAYKQEPGPVKGTPTNQSWLDRPRGDDLSAACGAYSEEVIIERFEEMARMFRRGIPYYRQGLAGVDESVRDPELCVAMIIPLMFDSVANVFKIHVLKKEWDQSKMQAFKSILRAERRVCEQALPIVRRDGRLGYNVDAQFYMFSEQLIREKIEYLGRALETPDQ